MRRTRSRHARRGAWGPRYPRTTHGPSNRLRDEPWRASNRTKSATAHSGGGAVVLGPGCIVYSLVLSLEERPRLCDVRASYRAILECVIRALAVPGLETRGSSDLAIGVRKVSGNAQRRGQRALLHHGTLLYRFNQAWMSVLKHPGREPDYRRGRSHDEFVANLPLDGAELRRDVNDLDFDVALHVVFTDQADLATLAEEASPQSGR